MSNSPQPAQQRRLYPIDDAAHVLGVSRTTIYELIKQQKLKKIAIGGRPVITAESIDALFAAAVADAES